MSKTRNLLRRCPRGHQWMGDGGEAFPIMNAEMDCENPAHQTSHESTLRWTYGDE